MMLQGFYTVYRVVFDLLKDEDAVYLDGKSDVKIPGFGDSKSSYEEVRHTSCRASFYSVLFHTFSIFL